MCLHPDCCTYLSKYFQVFALNQYQQTFSDFGTYYLSTNIFRESTLAHAPATIDMCLRFKFISNWNKLDIFVSFHFFFKKKEKIRQQRMFAPHRVILQWHESLLCQIMLNMSDNLVF